MESNTAFFEKARESSKVLKLPPVILPEELHTLIGTVKEIQLITTYEEVLDGLGQYIANKNLYDHQNQKVCCKDDVLGSVLGTEEFAMTDLKKLLPKLAVPVGKIHKDSAGGASLKSENPLKRKLDGISECDQRKIPAVKGVKSTSPMILHIPPSPNYCDVSDSIDSIQGYETAYAKDTSDEALSAENGEEKILAIEETYNIEYEVESDSSDSTLSEDSSDSECEEFCRNMEKAVFEFITAVIYKPKPDSDIEFFADASSDDDEQSDAEISESDFWSCPKCSIKNKPTVRYCFKCFQQRRHWLPDKPPNMRRKHRKPHASDKKTNELPEASLSKCDQDSQGSSSSSGVSCEIKESPSEPTSGVWSPNMKSVGSCNLELIDSPSVESPSVESIDSPYIKSISSHFVKSVDGIPSIESVDSFNMESSRSLYMESPGSSDMKSSGISSMESSGPSSMESSGPSSMESSGPSSMGWSAPSSMDSSGPSSMGSSGPSSMECTDSSQEELCLICCSKRLSASIIHGKFAHRISCYECARRLKKEKKDCPVCRRTIDRVVIHIV